MTNAENDLRTTIQMEREKREVYRREGYYRDVAEVDRRLVRLDKELGQLLWRQALGRMAKRSEEE